MTQRSQARPEDLEGLIPRLRRRARRLARSSFDADDLLQETLLQLCQRLADHADIRDLKAYAMRTMAHDAQRRWREPTSEALDEAFTATGSDVLLRLECAEVLDAVARLPEAQRRLMQIVIEGETSPRRIAERTGMPIGTVMSRLARARKRLRQNLAQ